MTLDTPYTKGYSFAAMKIFKIGLVSAVLLVCSTLVGQAQDSTPTLTIESPGPNQVVGGRLVIRGMATAMEGVEAVQYRRLGRKRWRNAILDETTDRNPTTIGYTIITKTRRGNNITRIQMRVIDIRRGESDFVTRKFRRRSRAARGG